MAEWLMVPLIVIEEYFKNMSIDRNVRITMLAMVFEHSHQGLVGKEVQIPKQGRVVLAEVSG